MVEFDINYEELEDLTLTMEDEDGTTTECELQFVFEYDGQDYGAFCEAENETGEYKLERRNRVRNCAGRR